MCLLVLKTRLISIVSKPIIIVVELVVIDVVFVKKKTLDLAWAKNIIVHDYWPWLGLAITPRLAFKK